MSSWYIIITLIILLFIWLIWTLMRLFLCSKCHVFRYNRSVSNYTTSFILIRKTINITTHQSSPQLTSPSFIKLCSCFGFCLVYIPTEKGKKFLSSTNNDLVAFEGITWSLVVEEEEKDSIIPRTTRTNFAETSLSTKPTKYNQVCSVCLDQFVHGDTLFTLACEHTFHFNCAIQLFLKDCYKCPYCQRVVDTQYSPGTSFTETTDIDISNYGTFFMSV